jgi:hypothetical protein
MNNQRDLTGILFKNDKKTSERHPAYKGSVTVRGEEFWLSAWIKEGTRGKFMSLALTSKNDQRREGANGARVTDDDDIRF